MSLHILDLSWYGHYAEVIQLCWDMVCSDPEGRPYVEVPHRRSIRLRQTDRLLEVITSLDMEVLRLTKQVEVDLRDDIRQKA